MHEVPVTSGDQTSSYRGPRHICRGEKSDSHAKEGPAGLWERGLGETAWLESSTTEPSSWQCMSCCGIFKGSENITTALLAHDLRPHPDWPSLTLDGREPRHHARADLAACTAGAGAGGDFRQQQPLQPPPAPPAHQLPGPVAVAVSRRGASTRTTRAPPGLLRRPRGRTPATLAAAHGERAVLL